MTYILGARCKDGVVLIGDRKITNEDGTQYSWSDKVFIQQAGLILGSSGVAGLFDKFLMRLQDFTNHEESDRYLYERIQHIEKVTRELNVQYAQLLGGQVFDVLMVLGTDVKPYLYYVNPRGFAEPETQYRAIGHGEPYGSVFLKQFWFPDITVLQTMELGYFIIKYIEKFALDGSVGIGNGHPQIYTVHDQERSKVKVVDKNSLDRMRELTERRLAQCERDMKQLFSGTLSFR